MELGQSIRSGTKWLVAGTGASQVLQFAFGIVLARLLVPADFGMVVTIQIFTGFASLIASGGMGEALVRAKSVEERDFQVVFTVQLIFGIVIYLVFFGIAPFFVEWFHDPLYRDLLRVSALSFIARPFANIHNIWLRREMRFKDTALIGLIGLVFTSCISVAMALAGMGVWSLTLSGLLGAALNIWMLSSRSPIRVKVVFDRGIVKMHGAYGAKTTINELVDYFRAQVSNLMISRMLGPVSVGIYNKADSLGKMPLSIVSGPVYQTVFRAMSVMQDDHDRTRYLFLRMISLLTVYTLPFYVGAWWMAEPLIGFVYGDNWLAAAPILEILSLAGILYCVGHPCGAVLAAQNRLGRELVAQLIGLVIVGVGSLVGLQWGLKLVAVAFLLGHVYTLTHMYWLVKQCLQVTFTEILTAMRPGLILNGMLVLFLILLNLVLPESMSMVNSGHYLAISLPLAALVYATLFLYLPLPAIAAEALQWKKMLRLPTRIQPTKGTS